jgi:PCI domain
MAAAFGISPDFMDKELADFIVAGHLSAKIDRVAGIVETNRCKTFPTGPFAWNGARKHAL